jgi:anthrone oxygenase-like protein
MPMLVVLKFVATFAAAMFAGAALYVNVAEHPARMTLDTRSAVAQWDPSYRRATWMQAPLALLSLVAGLGSWLLGGGLGWAIAALLIGAVVPFTFIGIMPTNRALLASGRDLSAAETRTLLEHWAKLHAVRTALSVAATILYLCLALES